MSCSEKREAVKPDETASEHKGKVVETMNASGYSYVLLDEGDKNIWIAGPQTPVKVGDEISTSGGSLMNNFKSKSLDKTFEWILFVGKINVAGMSAQDGGAVAGNPPIAMQGQADAQAQAHQASAPIEIKPGSIKKAPGGYTIAECFSNKSSLNGKTVKVRGKVVKFSEAIMGKNWIHLRDGSGKPGTDDLTITTKSKASLGNTVLITGKLIVDKDFGAGYKYAVIVEDAAVAVE